MIQASCTVTTINFGREVIDEFPFWISSASVFGFCVFLNFFYTGPSPLITFFYACSDIILSLCIFDIDKPHFYLWWQRLFGRPIYRQPFITLGSCLVEDTKFSEHESIWNSGR